jgi:glucosylceramidase
MTGASRVLLDTLPADERSRVMSDIFDPRRGIGLSVLRQPLGSNDFSTGEYSYDDVAPGRSDPRLDRFDLGPDRTRVIPLLVEAARRNRSLAVVLTPWSAPAWMKTSGSLVGGTLRPEYTQTYADYLVKAAQAYLDAGVPVTGLTAQNEPSFSPPSYPGMTLDVEQQRTLLRDHLRPSLDRAGLDLHLWALDDNFDRWPDADALLSDPATAAAVYGVAFHCYRGDVSALREIRSRHPGVAVAISECSGGTWSGGFADDLRYEARTLLVAAVRNGAAWLVRWNLALDPNGGPQNGGCRDCRGLVTVDPSTGTVTPSAGYYVWGHVGRFVTPGARVIAASVRSGSGLDAVAFQNPDDSHVLVVYNDGPRVRRVTVGADERSFAVQLPAGTLATTRW